MPTSVRFYLSYDHLKMILSHSNQQVQQRNIALNENSLSWIVSLTNARFLFRFISARNMIKLYLWTNFQTFCRSYEDNLWSTDNFFSLSSNRQNCLQKLIIRRQILHINSRKVSKTSYWLRYYMYCAFTLLQSSTWLNGLHRLKYLGPVVQSIVSLMTLLRRQLVKYMWTTLANTLLFFVGKMWESFAVQKILTFFSTKNNSVFVIFTFKSLTKC